MAPSRTPQEAHSLSGPSSAKLNKRKLSRDSNQEWMEAQCNTKKYIYKKEASELIKI
jgi:hypothetical protein